ncbi:MAG: NUDIX hydrolase [Deltaproteobacteria bacterium]|nr:NUDIX hydrolase [Deltaproteobacteria bacterium]
MHRSELLQRLERYAVSPFLTPEEGPALERMGAFVRAHPDCFLRALEVGHMTASAWVLDADGSRALLVHHKKLDRWLQPGGHADGNADLLLVACAEVREETGIEASIVSSEIFDVDVHPIPQHQTVPAHFHYDVRFLLCAPSDAQPIVSDESHDVRWFNTDEILRLGVDRSVERLVEKSRNLSTDALVHSLSSSGDAGAS